jgi:hypothetical protein
MLNGTAGWTRHPEWEDGVTSFWLRLEWVRVERGRTLRSGSQSRFRNVKLELNPEIPHSCA